VKKGEGWGGGGEKRKGRERRGGEGSFLSFHFFLVFRRGRRKAQKEWRREGKGRVARSIRFFHLFHWGDGKRRKKKGGKKEKGGVSTACRYYPF